MSVFNPEKMEYRYLGKSGLKVSVIAYGNMLNFLPENKERDLAIVKAALENGVNFFDTAEFYGEGKAETALGQQLKEIGVAREDLVVSTKVWTGDNKFINSDSTTNRKHVQEAIRESLARLQMDYVDLYFAHMFDEGTSVEETCRAFNDIIEEGLAFYWGTSNWPSEKVIEALGICERLNLHKPITAQNQYNLLKRADMEVDNRLLIEKYGFGWTAWSPLAGGFLTGKYLNGVPEGENRVNTEVFFDKNFMKALFYDPYTDPATIAALKSLKEIADELGCTLAQLSIAWTIKWDRLQSSITGARNAATLVDTLAAVQLLPKLTPEILEKISTLFKPPTAAFDAIVFGPRKPFRP